MCIRPKPSLDNFLHRDVRIVVLDNVRDPGNLGSIIRTAVCAGFDLVLCLSGCACAYSGKAVRSSAGSIFNIDVIENLRTDDAMPKLKSAGIAVFVTRLENAVVPYDVSLASNCAIVIGNEAVGVSKTVCNYADSFLRLPIE